VFRLTPVERLLVVLGVATLSSIFLGMSAFARQANEQFIPMFTFKVGPAAALGIATNAGYLDYWTMLNVRDGGIGGVKLVWEECETERKVEKGIECYEKLKNKGPTGATVINPIATDIAYALLQRTREDKIPMMTGGYGRTDTSDGSVFPYVFPIGTNYWSMNTAMVKYIGMRLGGVSRLQVKTIVNLHHGSAYGRETKEILDAQAVRYGFKIVHIEVPHPGKVQDEQWKQIVDLKPDWVILRGIGVMNPVAIMTAHKYGYPVSRILGVIWAGAEADVIPAGAAAKGYIAAALSLPGSNFPVIQDIIKDVYRGGKGNLPNVAGIGSTYYNRGVSGAIIIAEAIRTAQGKFGKRPLTGEEVRWGIENLNLSDRRIAELGAFGVSQPLRMSCADHEGGGTIRFQRWNGKEWRPVTGWIDGDQSMVRPMIEKSAAAYAAKEGFRPRDCSKVDSYHRLASGR
jgi:branched-chain amino acid transport system substrate-binding protein